jgi:tRNA modification GTPase
MAALRRISDIVTGETLDRSIVIRFPGPESSTGEDLVELHLHGGRSVVGAVLDTLASLDGVRPAQPGEFTRRAFENGRIDLAEAEGLADLLAAETQSQRRVALALAGGWLSRRVGAWQSVLLELAAGVEALLDFADEGDVEPELSGSWTDRLAQLIEEIDALLRVAPAERLREGVRVVIAGPPNAGKSSLLNALAGRRAAITSPNAGTTRDLIEAPLSLGGSPFLLIDTAGLRDAADDGVEAIGIDRAHETLAEADLVLWLGVPADCPCPERAVIVASKADLRGVDQHVHADLEVSAETGQGLDKLVELLIDRARTLLPREGEIAINRRHREALEDCRTALQAAEESIDLLVTAEALRVARGAIDRVTGRAGVEDMLGRLFGAFCIGK